MHHGDRFLEIVEPPEIANDSHRSGADILSHDLGLRQADGEAKHSANRVMTRLRTVSV